MCGKKNSVGEWISVKDELPEKRGTYIVMTAFERKPYKVMTMDFEIETSINKETQKYKWYGKLSPLEVTHWMPLPEPPKQ